MALSLPSPPNSPALLPRYPSPAQLLLFFLLLLWLAAAPIIIGIAVALQPTAWPELGHSLLAVGLLAGLLLIPFGGFAFLTRTPGWAAARPLAVMLVGVGLYISLDALIRAVAEPPQTQATYLLPLPGLILRLTLLTPAALLLGGLGLGSRADLRRALGLSAPHPLGLLLALTAAAILTLGWPLTGALGDGWTSQMLLIQTLAVVLPEELFFRGVIPALLNDANLSHSPMRSFAYALIPPFIYLAYIPSLILPHQEWGWLLFLSALPLALLALQLRRLTGAIWAGTLLLWLSRAAPLLFTDPRDELPLLTEPWQTAARLWLLAGAFVLAGLVWWAGRWLAPRWRLSGRSTVGLGLAVCLLSWGMWLGMWLGLGRPGFYDDGFLIVMTEQADLSGAAAITNLTERRAFVQERLIETANRTQGPVRQALEAAGLPYRPFYLINMIRVEGHHRQMEQFAHLPGVARVMLNPNVRPYPLAAEVGYGDTPQEGRGVEWNLSQVQVDQAWALGYTGQGVVVAGQDTGYDWQHPALRRAYRGVDAAGHVNHNYNWHDAWDNTAVPFDDGQHGTHTMGTILGDDGQGNQIGMAPGARWIGCRNMRRGLGNPASYTDCMQFFLAPYPLGGDPFSQGDVTQSPQVVNNSWGCPDIEGCDDAILQPALDALHTAGIMMVVSAGNDGPACATAVEPPARYASAFSVGATEADGAITGFSSRGPVLEGQSPLLKPDIAAPGADIRSSIPGGRYGTAAGTSMAGPHVAGLVALIWSANPALTGQLDATEEIIRQSARPMPVSAACPLNPNPASSLQRLVELEGAGSGLICACGGMSGVPNNVYGWGEIDALQAVKLALVRKNGG